MPRGSPSVCAATHTGVVDIARAEVAARGEANVTIERIVHQALGHTAPAIALRARLLLRRFFSEMPWTSREAGSLAGIVGNGSEWHTLDLADDLRVSFGWRAGQFRIDAWCDATVELVATRGDAPTDTPTRAPSTVGDEWPTVGALDDAVETSAEVNNPAPRSIDESFDGPVDCDTRPGNRVVAFKTGPGTGSGLGSWFRPGDPVADPRIGALLVGFPMITGVLELPGGYDVELAEHASWCDHLLPILGRFTTHFAGPRSEPVPDRDELRAVEEFERLDLRTVSAQLRIRNSLTDCRPYVRRLALDVIVRSDPRRATQFWRKAIDDSARDVRRVAVIGASKARNEELRPMLERALIDVDARVRFHAVRGLWFLGPHKSRTAISRTLFDADARVRTAAQCVVRGVRPPD